MQTMQGTYPHADDNALYSTDICCPEPPDIELALLSVPGWDAFRQGSIESSAEEQLLLTYDLFPEVADEALWGCSTLDLDAAAAAALLQDKVSGQIELPSTFDDTDVLIKEEVDICNEYLVDTGNLDSSWVLADEVIIKDDTQAAQGPVATSLSMDIAADFQQEQSAGSSHSHSPAASCDSPCDRQMCTFPDLPIMFHGPYDSPCFAGLTAVQIARAAAIARYRAKKLRRCHTKHIRYAARKVNADRRPRVKGRFVKREEAAKMLLEQQHACMVALE